MVCYLARIPSGLDSARESWCDPGVEQENDFVVHRWKSQVAKCLIGQVTGQVRFEVGAWLEFAVYRRYRIACFVEAGT